jgi:hypothetical protein
MLLGVLALVSGSIGAMSIATSASATLPTGWNCYKTNVFFGITADVECYGPGIYATKYKVGVGTDGGNDTQCSQAGCKRYLNQGMTVNNNAFFTLQRNNGAQWVTVWGVNCTSQGSGACG